MTAVLKHLKQMTNAIFEAQMNRAAKRIRYRQQLFSRRPV
jgi:hypothetical protein